MHACGGMMKARPHRISLPSVIPHIIHQTWKTTTLPPQYVAAAESWRRMHPGWTYHLWTDEMLDAFVRERYPDVWPLWRSYPDQIQRVDTARYMLLHHFGGIYSDLDIECLRSMEPLCAHDVVLPRTAPVGVSNDLMLAVPGHPLFAMLIAGMGAARERWSRWWMPRHFRVMLTTASLYLTAQLRAFPDAEAVHILAPELYSSQDRARAYVYHLPGNTWAAWDTHVFVFLHRHWRWLVGGAAVLLLAWMVM